MRSAVSLLLLGLAVACSSETPPPPYVLPPDTPELRAAREEMIAGPVARLGVDDPVILDAIRAVPRHAFAPPDLARKVYGDRAVARPDGEVLIAPGLTAVMIRALALTPESRVLEVGTRSGYTTALLARIAGEVFTIDARPGVIAGARAVHAALGIGNVHYRVAADPTSGWPEAGPFDAILVKGVVRHLPRTLYASLAPGGRLLAPVGTPDETQTLVLTVRGDPDPVSTRPVLAVRFGPLQKP